MADFFIEKLIGEPILSNLILMGTDRSARTTRKNHKNQKPRSTPKSSKKGDANSRAGHESKDKPQNKTESSSTSRVRGLPKNPPQQKDKALPIYRKSYTSKSPRFKPGPPPKTNKGKKSSRQTAKKKQEVKFTTLNTTNVQLVRKYFDTISPTLFDTLAKTGQFILYQSEGAGYEIFLVPSEISPMIKQLNKNYPLISAGIYIGFMKRVQTRTHFERQFFLSFEGGRFIWEYVNENFPEIKSDLQSVTLDEEGEKAFFYGRNIELDDVISETDHLVKKKITFVLDQHGEYIGLALLMVKQAGAKKPVLGIKTTDLYSRSPHFKLNLLNLSDGGIYLRKGS